MDTYPIRPIAHIHNALKDKFGIPRQSLLVDELESEVVFTPEYRVDDALRGIEGFSHLWLIWCFSKSVGHDWSPTVRPPRLGGNTRLGVFATRSPFRPNNLGLSCVRLVRLEQRPDCGTVLIVAGADIMDGTPIFDIKPYLPYADSIPDASGGFAPDGGKILEVHDENGILTQLTERDRAAITALLARDPRPQYQNDPDRIYGMRYGELDIKFRVTGNELLIIDINDIKIER